MTRPESWRDAPALVPALALALLGITGCAAKVGGDDIDAAAGPRGNGTPPAAHSQSQATTTSIPLVSDATVLAAYRAFWADVAAASHAPDGNAPRLDDHATGQALAVFRAQLEDRRQRGQVARGTPALLAPRVLQRDRRHAVVGDCMDSRAWQYHDVRTGRLIGQPGAHRYSVTAQLTLDRPAWKVATLIIEESQCAG